MDHSAHGVSFNSITLVSKNVKRAKTSMLVTALCMGLQRTVAQIRSLQPERRSQLAVVN